MKPARSMAALAIKALILSITLLVIGARAFAATVTVTIASGFLQPVPIPLPTRAGQPLFFLVSYSTTDPNEYQESEPLNIQSSGGFASSIKFSSPGQTNSFQYTPSMDGETFSAFIGGYDGDESASITMSTEHIEGSTNLAETGRGLGDKKAAATDPSFTRWLPLSFSPVMSSQPSRRGYGLEYPWGNINCAYSITLREDINPDQPGEALAYSQSAQDPFEARYSITDANAERLVFDPDLFAYPDVHSTLVWLTDGRYQLQNAGPPGALKHLGRYTYTFEALSGNPGRARLLSIADDLGNRQTCSWSNQSPQLTVTDSSSGRKLIFDRQGTYFSSVVAPVSGSSMPATRTTLLVDATGHLRELKVYQGIQTTPLHTDTFGVGGPNGDSITSTAQGASLASHSYVASAASDAFGMKIGRISSSALGRADDTTSSDDALSIQGTQIYTYGALDPAATGAVARTNTFRDARGNLSSLLYSFGSDPLDNTLQGPIQSLRVTRPTYTGASGANESTMVYSPDVTSPTQVTLTDPLGHAWQTTLDLFGNITGTLDPLLHGGQYGYSDDGLNLIRVTDPTNIVTTLNYGENGNPASRLTSVVDNAGNIQQQIGYNGFGQPIQATVPAATAASGMDQTSLFNYHSATGDLIGITGPTGDKVMLGAYDYLGDVGFSIVYPDTGDPATSTTPLTTRTSWDAAQQVTQVQLPNGTRTVNTWNDGGKITNVQINGPGGGLSWMQLFYDSRGRVYQTTDPVGVAAQYRYDKEDNLTQIWDGRGKITQLAYGPNRESIGVNWPDGRATSAAYDAAGRLASTTDERAIVKNYTFDNADRPTGTLFADTLYSAYNIGVTNYDEAGRPGTITDNTGSTTFGYDPTLKRLQSVDTVLGGQSYRVSYTYFPDGKRQSMTTPAGATSYNYDAIGRLVSLTNPLGEITSWSYDHAGRLITQMTTTGPGVPIVTRYSYGNTGQVGDTSTAPVEVRGITQSVNALPLAVYTLTHSYLGQILSQSGTGSEGVSENASYGYDNRGRLTSDSEHFQAGAQSADGGGTYSYDLSNNLQGGTGGWTYNDSNQVTNAPLYGGLPGVPGLSYDNAGNLSGGAGMTLVWDPWGRLQTVTNTPSGTISFTYDFAGRRASKTVGATTTYYLYDANALVAELDSGGNVVRSYTWGGTGLISDQVSGQSRFYLFDGTGSTRALVAATGTVLSRGMYSAWGSPLPSLTPDTPLGWNGRSGAYQDTETGLILMGARYYSRGLGRFISRDSSGFVSGPNLYAYCMGDPVDFSDPDGMKPQWVESSLRWYWGGMGGLTDLEDRYLLKGSAAHFGEVTGRHDAGKASALEVTLAGAEFAYNIGDTALALYGGGSMARGSMAKGLASLAKAAIARDAVEAGLFVSTPNGHTVPIPEGWVSRAADNGRGIVFQRPGATGNADMIRIMDPNPRYPEGYVRYHNKGGQPLDVLGRPTDKASTHIPLDYTGPLPKWPR